MFYPVIMNGAAPHIRVTQTVMPQGTGVKWDVANPGQVIPALDGMNVVGFTAQAVIDYNARPREFDTVPELFVGRIFDPVMINRPGSLAGTTNVATNVGIWMDHNQEFECDIRDEATGAPVVGLLPGQALVVGAAGLLTPAKAGGDARPTVAKVVGPGFGTGLPINTTVPTYLVKLEANLG